MDLFETIDGRRSASRLGEPAPSSAQLERILLAAVSAPDHGRLSPWRFHVMQGERMALLASAFEAALRRKYPDATPDMVAAARGKALRAPVLVVVAARPSVGHKVPENEQVMAVAAAVQNLLLAATALGFGSMWKTGGPAYDKDVKLALGLAATDHIVGFVYLGTTTTVGKPRTPTLEGLVQHL